MGREVKTMIKAAIVVIAILGSAFSAAFAGEIEVYDRDWILRHRIDEKGGVYDKSYNPEGRIEGNKIYDRNRNLKGRIEGDRIYDKDWNLRDRIRGDRIYDENWNLKGRIRKR